MNISVNGVEINYAEEGLLTEESFMSVWQSGAYRMITSDREDYCKFIKSHVEKYGKELNRDRVLYRASSTYEEDEETLSGGSWTPSLEDAFGFANSFGLNRVYSMVVPEGTKTISFNPKPRYPEKENLLDTVSVKNDTLKVYARLVKEEFEKGKVKHYWRMQDGKTKVMDCPKRTIKMMSRGNYYSNPIAA